MSVTVLYFYISRSVKFENKPSLPNKRIISEEIIEDADDKLEQPSSSKKVKIEDDSNSADIINVPSSSSIIPPKVIAAPKAAKSTESWNKSIGVASRKGGLAGLVKINKKHATSNGTETSSVSSDQSSSVSSNNVITPVAVVPPAVVNVTAKPSLPAASGLSLLAGYSDSDSNHESD